MTNDSDGDEFTETAYAVLVWFNEHHPSKSKYPPRPKQWADLTALGRYPIEVERQLREDGVDSSLFDHSDFVVPEDDYHADQNPRGYRTSTYSFEATPNEIAAIRAAARKDDA